MNRAGSSHQEVREGQDKETAGAGMAVEARPKGGRARWRDQQEQAPSLVKKTLDAGTILVFQGGPTVDKDMFPGTVHYKKQSSQMGKIYRHKVK